MSIDRSVLRPVRSTAAGVGVPSAPAGRGAIPLDGDAVGRPRPAAVTAAPPPPLRLASPAAPLSEAELFRRKSLADLNAEHPLSDAFFDYNQNILREDAKQALQQDARWLAKWPQTRDPHRRTLR